MQWRGKELGSQEMKPVTFKLYGDPGVASKYMDKGRFHLGELKLRMQLNSNLTWGEQRIDVVDGTIIHVMTNRNGLSDIDEITIDVTALADKTPKEKICKGFIAMVNAVNFNSVNTQLNVQGPDDTTHTFLHTTYTPAAQFVYLENAVPGIIPNTFDDTDDPEVGGYKRILYGELSTDSVDYKYAPLLTFRNSRQNIAVCRGIPVYNGSSITVTYSVNFEGFIAVVPGSITYNFIDPELSGRDPDLSGPNNTVSRAFHNFTATASVPKGDYVLQAAGKVDVLLICDKGLEKAQFTFSDVNTIFYSQEMVVTVGKKFKNVSEIVKVRDLTTLIS